MKNRKEKQYMINLNSLKNQILELGQKIGLQVQEEDAKSVTLHATITAPDYFIDSIYLRLVVFSSGTMHMFLTFNEIEKTYERFFAINNYNADSPWFKAYIVNINGKNFFELHYSSAALKGEQEVLDTFSFLLGDLLSDNSLKHLRPILKDEQ